MNRYLSTLKRWWWVYAAGIALWAIVIVGIWALTPTRYVARGLLCVDPRRELIPALLRDSAEARAYSVEYGFEWPFYVGIELELLNSPYVMRQTVEALQLASPGTDDLSIARRAEQLYHEVSSNGSGIDSSQGWVEWTSTDPQLACQVVDTIIGIYLDMRRQQAGEGVLLPAQRIGRAYISSTLSRWPSPRWIALGLIIALAPGLFLTLQSWPQK